MPFSNIVYFSLYKYFTRHSTSYSDHFRTSNIFFPTEFFFSHFFPFLLSSFLTLLRILLPTHSLFFFSLTGTIYSRSWQRQFWERCSKHGVPTSNHGGERNCHAVDCEHFYYYFSLYLPIIYLLLDIIVRMLNFY